MRAVEGLRGVAVILVFLQHYAMQAILHVDLDAVGAEIAALMRNFGTLGVELFFILSGFLIHGTLLRRRPGFMAFMARRMERIYPTFLCVFLPVAAAHAMFATGDVPADFKGATLVLLANLLMLPGVFAFEPLMAVAWTLSWEMAFYLVLGIAVPALRMAEWPRHARVGLILAGIACLTWASHGLPDGIGPFSSPLPALPFLFGMLLFEAEDAGAWSVPGGAGLVAGLVSLTIGHWFSPSPLGRTLMETVALSLLCSAAFRGNNRAAAAMSIEALRWLGNMSYSYYLVHGLVVVAAFRGSAWLLGGGFDAWTFWPLAGLMFVASLVPSLMVFVAVERRWLVGGRVASGDAQVAQRPVLGALPGAASGPDR